MGDAFNEFRNYSFQSQLVTFRMHFRISIVVLLMWDLNLGEAEVLQDAMGHVCWCCLYDKRRLGLWFSMHISNIRKLQAFWYSRFDFTLRTCNFLAYWRFEVALKLFMQTFIHALNPLWMISRRMITNSFLTVMSFFVEDCMHENWSCLHWQSQTRDDFSKYRTKGFPESFRLSESKKTLSLAC